LRELPEAIQGHREGSKSLGLELDVLPVRDYFRYQDFFPGIRIVDSSSLMKDIRKIKSTFEIDLMRVAGEIGKKVYHEAKPLLKEG